MTNKLHKPEKPIVGRNSPCPCGSGKKFKKCCLVIDITGSNRKYIKQTAVPGLQKLGYHV